MKDRQNLRLFMRHLLLKHIIVTRNNFHCNTKDCDANCYDAFLGTLEKDLDLDEGELREQVEWIPDHDNYECHTNDDEISAI